MNRFHALPVRWRVALTSAGLTFAILLVFAVVIGLFTGRQLRSDFDQDLRVAAADLQEKLDVSQSITGEITVRQRAALADVAGAGDVAIRIVTVGGGVLFQTPDAPGLGPPRPGVVEAGSFRVVSRPIVVDPLAQAVFVQYARPTAGLDATIARIRLFLALGVLGGTALALLAGLAVARRAMSPIASLTAAAQGVARTRDPAARLPQPGADDEVAELARTLEEMLRALDAARGETEAALERQREFVADASHELRTPLTSILANLELLEAGLRGEDAEIAASALRSSRRMRRLVADLLLLARADAGRQTPREPVDLSRVVRDATAEATGLAAAHDISVDAPAQGPLVDGSDDDLHRLVLNLIENAVVHTPPGTTVRVAVRRNGGLEPGDAVIEVSDDGPGVPPELRGRVFDRFVKGNGDGRGGGLGTGLGLAIVRAVAEAHGGSVWMGEAGSGGARFTVTLPAGTGGRVSAPGAVGRAA